MLTPGSIRIRSWRFTSQSSYFSQEQPVSGGEEHSPPRLPQQQQHWLNPKLGAKCTLASSDHASLCRKCSVRPHASPSLMQWFTCGPFWLMGRDKATGLEVMPFREGTGRNYPVWVCSVYRCTDKNRGWTPRKGTHCSLAKVADSSHTAVNSSALRAAGRKPGTVPQQGSEGHHWVGWKPQIPSPSDIPFLVEA